VRRWARDSGFEHSLDEPFSEWEIQSFEQHVLWWADPGRADRAAFLDASSERRSVDEIPPLEGDDAWSRVEAICRRLARRGLSAYAVDVTAPDIREAGLWVARAVVPELCPLDVVHGIRYLGGRRLYEAPVEAGLRDRPLDPSELNPDPHPFP
jgi:ribosomal protein S12 methylthiotransferase accessory factor